VSIHEKTANQPTMTVPAMPRPSLEPEPMARMRRDTFGSHSPAVLDAQFDPRRSELLARKLKQGLITEAELNSLFQLDQQAGKLDREVQHWTQKQTKVSRARSRSSTRICTCEDVETTETCFRFSWSSFFTKTSNGPSSQSKRHQSKRPSKRASITAVFRQSLHDDCQSFVSNLKVAQENSQRFSQQPTDSCPSPAVPRSKHGRRSSFVTWLAAKPAAQGRRLSCLISPPPVRQL
jgi:hypothetical protein